MGVTSFKTLEIMRQDERTKQAIEEIMFSGMFEDNELTQIKDGMHTSFESWEYYLVLYLTDSDIYYQGEEEAEHLASADVIQDTKWGRFYCFS